MGTFIAMASFSPETDLPQMSTVIAEEIAQVQALRAEGRLGAVHVSAVKGRVFIEVTADDEESARHTVGTLPMAKWWEVEFFPTQGPPPAGS